MANEKKHIAHVKSAQTVINNDVTEPKLPAAEDIIFGELAVNYAAGYERISLKNSAGNIVPFVSKAYVDSKAGESVTNVAYDGTNKKITKTVGGSTTTDVVTAATIVADGGGITSLPDGEINGTPGANKTFTAFSQSNGKVSATIGDISITKSQVSDLGTIGDAAAKSVDTTISDGSTSVNVPTSSAVASFVENKGYTTNTGTVTSVGITVPTGLAVTGSPITTNGTLAIALDNGYVIPQQTTLDSFLKGTIEVVSVTADNNSYDAGTIAEGTQKHVIFNNGGSADYIVTIPTTYQTPDGQPIELTVPQGGYAEANFMNINSTIYVRGL